MVKTFSEGIDFRRQIWNLGIIIFIQSKWCFISSQMGKGRVYSVISRPWAPAADFIYTHWSRDLFIRVPFQLPEDMHIHSHFGARNLSCTLSCLYYLYSLTPEWSEALSVKCLVRLRNIETTMSQHRLGRNIIFLCKCTAPRSDHLPLWSYDYLLVPCYERGSKI